MCCVISRPPRGASRNGFLPSSVFLLLRFDSIRFVSERVGWVEDGYNGTDMRWGRDWDRRREKREQRRERHWLGYDWKRYMVIDDWGLFGDGNLYLGVESFTYFIVAK